MSRLMSFSATIEQFKNRSKDLTTRMGWIFLKPGDILEAVEKCQGIPKGGHVVRIGRIEIVSVRFMPLIKVVLIPGYCRREGFPEMEPMEFIDMFCKLNRCDRSRDVTLIEFKILEVYRRCEFCDHDFDKSWGRFGCPKCQEMEDLMWWLEESDMR